MNSVIAQHESKNYCPLIPTPTVKQEKKLGSGQWVHVIKPLTALNFDEALLLCQESLEKWVVWVPGFGEARLKIGEFVL